MLIQTTINAKWTKSLLQEFGWKESSELFSALSRLNSAILYSNTLGPLPLYVHKLRKLFVQAEQLGDINQETRRMTAPGALLESLSFDQLQIRKEYLAKRRQLKKQLAIIATLSKQQ